MQVAIFIHGYLSNAEDFGSLPSELADSYDEVIMITLPGHEVDGDLDDFTYLKMRLFIDETLAMLCSSYDAVDLIGFSLGGAIANYLAKISQINRLVLISPAVKYLGSPLIHERINFIFRNTTYKGLLHQDQPFGEKKMPIAFFEGLNYLYQHDKQSLTVFDEIAKKRFNALNGIAFMRITHYLNQEKGKVKCPTLLIWGSLDELVPYKAISACYDNCINEEKEIIIVPEVGHIMLRLEHMEPVKQKIKAFLNKGSENDR